MADDKNGREKQAREAERRQLRREIEMELERWDEPEPPIEPTELAALEAELESLTFPATGAEVVEAAGERELESPEGIYRLAELVPKTETFDAPEAVRVQVERPTVAATMKRILEASAPLQNEELAGSQRAAYEKTFQALKAIDADDEDEGVEVVADWIVEQIREKERLPGSRAVRRRAAEFCRANGYEVRVDDWLGI